MHARVSRDVDTAKKGKWRVVDEKSVTRCNGARVSFENRVKNGGLFAYAPAARGLRHGPRSCAAAWAVPGAACASGWDAGVGQAVRSWAALWNRFLIFQ